MKTISVIAFVSSCAALVAPVYAAGFDEESWSGEEPQGTNEMAAVEAAPSPTLAVPQPDLLDIKQRSLALDLELTGGSLGGGAEASLDLGYVALAAGVAWMPFEGSRKYAMVRIQSRGVVAGYIGVGGASISDYHVGTLDLFTPESQRKMQYTEESSNVMVEFGAKLQLGYVSARVYVGADSQVHTNCIESQGDCDHQPIYGGLALGYALHQ